MKRLIYGSLSALTAVCTVFVAAKAEVFTAESQGSATREDLTETAAADRLSGLPQNDLFGGNQAGAALGNSATRTAKNQMLASSMLQGLNPSESYQTQSPAGFTSSGLLSQVTPIAKPSSTPSATETKPVEGDASLTAPQTSTGAPVVTPGLLPVAEPALIPAAPTGVGASVEMEVEGGTEFGADPLAEEELAQDGEMMEEDAGAEDLTPDAEMDSEGMVGEEPMETDLSPADGMPADGMGIEENVVPGAVPAEEGPVEEGPVDEGPVEEGPVEAAPAEADMAPAPGLGQPPLPEAPANSTPVTPIPPASSPVTPGLPPSGLPPAGVPSSPAPSAPLPPLPEEGDMEEGDFNEGGMDDGGMDDGGMDDGDEGFGDEALPPVESDSAAPNQFPVSGSSGGMLMGEGFTPFQLSYLAISGGLKDEGIPGGDKLVMAYEDGDISAEDIVGAGAMSNRLGSAAEDEADYIKGVDRFLKIFKRDARSSN